ncbi:hypothetical protein [Streptomyces sp. SD15]
MSPGRILATWRPKRHRDYECYSRGGPCWVHEEYPYVWALGLGSTLLLGAALIAVLVRRSAVRKPAEPPTT